MKLCSRFVLSLAASLSFLQIAVSQALSAQSSPAPPKREFRGAWIATVTNLDWPSPAAQGSGGNYTQVQKDQLNNILDKLASVGFNAVIFQVRTECDALYNSPYEPWSYWLTGEQGKAPNPLYDPLQFAVEEAHKRGMELHAWFNPYRAVRPSVYTRASSHVSNTHPEWILDFPTGKILDPGLPSVRNYVALVVSDIVRRYDIDGIHADDYFYPYPDGSFPGITNQDDSTFAHYNPNNLNRGTWRRENVNLLLEQIRDSVQAIKPYVKFGMSPFGIWKNGVPPGIVGLDAYSTIYCDAIAWLKRRYIDYLAPQLYWAFGGGQDYAKLQPWWADSAAANGRHLYTGNATYRTGTGYLVTEIPNQINFNRTNSKVQGSIQFRATNIIGNLGGIYDLLRSDVFLFSSVIPRMSWKNDTLQPNRPAQLSASEVSPNSYQLSWTPPSAAADGDTAARYAVYRFTTAAPTQSDWEKGRNLIGLTGISRVVPRAIVDTVGVQFFYAVSALDRNNNESALADVIQMPGAIPVPPTLAYPVNGEENFPRNSAIQWNRSLNALGYLMEFDSTAVLGSTSMFVRPNVSDTFFVPTGLAAQKTYYWRVAAGSQIGTSQYSSSYSFRTGWPLPPTLIAPVTVTNAPIRPTFVWTKSKGTSFRVRVVSGSWTTGPTVLDTTVTDTTLTSSRDLPPPTTYIWAVSASNAYGSSDWSVEGRFRTQQPTLVQQPGSLPTEYSLSQNYPNPFNPTTTIEFGIPVSGNARITVYNLLGQQVAVLLDEFVFAGKYKVYFVGRDLPSGIYFYTLSADDRILRNKMLLLK